METSAFSLTTLVSTSVTGHVFVSDCVELAKRYTTGSAGLTDLTIVNDNTVGADLHDHVFKGYTTASCGLSEGN